MVARSLPISQKHNRRRNLLLLRFCKKRLDLMNKSGMSRRAVANVVAEALGRTGPVSANKRVHYALMAEFHAKYAGIDGIAKQIDETGICPSSAPTKRQKATARTPALVRGMDVNSDAFLLSYEWRRLRMEVIKERGRRCECCGLVPTKDNGVVIHVDHIKPRRKYPELALTKANLQVLCEVCNHGKGSWDETDWRADSHTSRESLDSPVPRSGDGDGQKPGAGPRLVARTQEKAQSA